MTTDLRGAYESAVGPVDWDATTPHTLAQDARMDVAAERYASRRELAAEEAASLDRQHDRLMRRVAS